MNAITLRSMLVLLVGGASLAGAGPLDPPSGEIKPTMKPLYQVEPRIPITSENCPGDYNSMFLITKAGSYYLTGNVTGQTAKMGIKIAVSNVTIDLNGFRLGGAGGTLDGIQVVYSDLDNIVVMNGYVDYWDGRGVHLKGTGCQVINVVASHNAKEGFAGGTGTVFQGCKAIENEKEGFASGWGSTLSDCVATRNLSAGFVIAKGSVAQACAATENGGDGFFVSNGSSALGCTSSSNGGDGFELTEDGRVGECNAFANTACGFYAQNTAHISSCTANRNGLDGISVSWLCTVTDNHCRKNGFAGDGAGIRVRSDGERTCVQRNNLVDNDWGLRVDGEANLVTGNTCSFNPVNYLIVAGNRVGAITVLPMAGAINGNAGGSSAGADPISNFAF